MTEQKWTVGQRVFIKKERNRAKDPETVDEFKVEKIGRKWVYCRHVSRSWAKEAFDKNTKRTKPCGYGGTRRVYESREEHREGLRRKRMWTAVQRRCDWHKPPPEPSVLYAVAELLRVEE